MSKVILDLGSGLTHKNDIDEAKRMIDAAVEVDNGKHEIIFKHQLFRDIAPCTPLLPWVFDAAFEHAAKLGYKTTASVFDQYSIDILKDYPVPFVKIACRDRLYPMLFDGSLDAWGDDVVVSVDDPRVFELICKTRSKYKVLACVPEYPANTSLYESYFAGLLHYGLSDHTTDLYLWEKYKPEIWERHFCLDDSTGLDAGPFAIRPSKLKEALDA
jgi:sialic acid synthase SpsE